MRPAALTDALAKVGITPCGDSGCMFGTDGGMHTNGGCCCLDGAPSPLVLRRLVMKLAMVARDLADRRANEDETMRRAIKLVECWRDDADDNQAEHDFCDAVRQLPGWKDEPEGVPCGRFDAWGCDTDEDRRVRGPDPRAACAAAPSASTRGSPS